jgi:hypothetical protein
MEGTNPKVRRKPAIAILAAALAVAMLGALQPATAAADTVVSCPFDPSGTGDRLDRGFYVTGYPGTNLDQVTLEYDADTAGAYTFTLTARSGSYAGPVIGASTVSASIPATSAATTPVTFSFAAAPVASGSTITFAQTYTGPDTAHYNTGVPPCPGVIETESTTPPLDTFRDDGVGVTITQVVSPPAPPAGATGQRAAALKKCKKKHSAKKRKKCRKKAKRLPV